MGAVRPIGSVDEDGRGSGRTGGLGARVLKVLERASGFFTAVTKVSTWLGAIAVVYWVLTWIWRTIENPTPETRELIASLVPHLIALSCIIGIVLAAGLYEHWKGTHKNLYGGEPPPDCRSCGSPMQRLESEKREGYLTLWDRLNDKMTPGRVQVWRCEDCAQVVKRERAEPDPELVKQRLAAEDRGRTGETAPS